MDTPKKFIGYHSDDALPIKPGQYITIKKGVMVKTIGRPAKPAGRTYRVKVNHLLGGQIAHKGYHGQDVPESNPVVRWAGPGGYWTEADINDIPEAQQ